MKLNLYMGRDNNLPDEVSVATLLQVVYAWVHSKNQISKYFTEETGKAKKEVYGGQCKHRNTPKYT